VSLGATNIFVQNSIGRSVEESSEMVPYLCWNTLQVECTLCLAKAALVFYKSNYTIGIESNLKSVKQ
jgi:hypothetical protein